MSQRIWKSLLVCKYQILILCLNFVFTCDLDCMRTLEGKVVGGSKVADKAVKIPHAVYLSMGCGDLSIICGASVVNQNVLISAAHCLQCDKDFEIYAKAGHEDLQQANVVRLVLKYVAHPKYSPISMENDISLLYVSKPLPLGENIKRVIINRGYPENLSTAYLAGWGVTNEQTRSRPFHLRMVKADVHIPSECVKLGRLLPGMVCAGTYEQTDDRPSHGDSGSALITAKHEILGVLSFRRIPYMSMMIYTNVSYFYSWIKDQANEMYCNDKKMLDNRNENKISVKSWKNLL